MERKVVQLRKSFPDAAILTNVEVSEGMVIISASIEADGRELARSMRVYPQVPPDGLSGLAAVSDALCMLGIIAEEQNLPREKDSVEAEEQSRAATTEAGGRTESEGCDTMPDPLPSKPNKNESLLPDSDEKRRGRPKKAAAPAPSDAEIEKARETYLAFRQDMMEAKEVPINLLKQAGKSLGKLMDEQPHFVKYLTQPGGKVYVTDDVCMAAETLLRVR